MKIKILGQFSFQSFPIADDMVEVDDELLKEIGKTKCFDLETSTIIDYDNSQEVKRNQTQSRIQELKSLLNKTDYQAIKYAEGFISEEDYAPIKAQRQKYRDEINKLEATYE